MAEFERIIGTNFEPSKIQQLGQVAEIGVIGMNGAEALIACENIIDNFIAAYKGSCLEELQTSMRLSGFVNEDLAYFQSQALARMENGDD